MKRLTKKQLYDIIDFVKNEKAYTRIKIRDYEIRINGNERLSIKYRDEEIIGYNLRDERLIVHKIVEYIEVSDSLKYHALVKGWPTEEELDILAKERRDNDPIYNNN